jgi:hypothetical protein
MPSLVHQEAGKNQSRKGRPHQPVGKIPSVLERGAGALEHALPASCADGENCTDPKALKIHGGPKM